MGKAIAPTFNDADLANIRQLKETLHLDTDSEAVRAAVQRYFALSYRDREKLERKFTTWKQHRNRGHRTLAAFDKSLPKRKAKTHVLPRPAPVPREADKAAQTSLNL
jgi:hypothetical protein